MYEYEAPKRANDVSGQRRRNRKSGGDGSDSESSSDESDQSAGGARKHAGDGKNGNSALGNDAIDNSSLRRNDAAARFNGATDLNANTADFSGRLPSRRSRKATRPRDAGLETTTYVIDGAAALGSVGAAKESVVDRLRRLKFETSQLEEELSASAKSVNGEAASGQGADLEEVDNAEVLAQLKVLQDQLAKLPSSSTSFSPSNADQQAIRTLLQQVKQPPASAASQSIPATSSDVSAAQAPASGSTDMVQLEARLSELESTLGIQQAALLDETKSVPRPVLSTLQRLEHQLSLLSQPRHLDAISRRVKVLVTEMDRVHDVRRKLTTTTTEPPSTTTAETTSATSTLTSAEIGKLQHLFDISTRLEPLLPLVPNVLSRLQTLSDLHASAAHFGSSLDSLEQGREERQREEKELEELLGKMEKNMQENSGKVEANLTSLQQRMEDLAARLEKVSR